MPSPHIRPPLMASFATVTDEASPFYDPVLGISWLDMPAQRPEPEGAVSLVDAVAGIVAVAADLAHQAGDLLALRQAVGRALCPARQDEAGLDPR